MFFYASRIFWLLLQPLNMAILLLVLGLVLLLLRWRRSAITAIVTALVVLLVATWTSLGALALGVLEDRFAKPAPPPSEIAGVIVLGGGVEGAVNLARGGHDLNSSGDRIVEGAVLGLRYPQARIVISGGSGDLLLEGEGDAESAPRLLRALGIDAARILQEGRSRNTYENAVFSRELVQPQPGETWLLVTSAFHMPRSMALFRKAGFDVVAWPVDYRTTGEETAGLAEDNVIDTLTVTNLAIREWIGLFAYWLTGRIDSPFPAP